MCVQGVFVYRCPWQADPMEFEAVVNNFKSALRIEPRSLAMAACAQSPSHLSSPSLCLFHCCYSIKPWNWRGGGDMDGRTCSLARFVKTMFNHPQVYITCPALGKILEMQACNYTVVVTMFFTSTVLQRPSQMSQAILLPIFKDRQFLSTHPPFFVLFWFLR